MNQSEIKFWIREKFVTSKIVILYFIKEPYYEIKRILRGYYNSMLLFWITLILYVIMWTKHVGGYRLKTAGLLVIFSYFYMFFKSGSWKEYYKKEYVEGKEVE